MIDLHMHTTYSDGCDTPLELLKKVVASGCKIFSITDHNNIEANEEIIVELQKQEYDIKYITGMEFSTFFQDHNFHLLCYNFDINDANVKLLFKESYRLWRKKISAYFTHLQEKHNIIIPEKEKMEIINLENYSEKLIYEVAIKHGLTTLSVYDFCKTCLYDMNKNEYKVNAEYIIEVIHKSGGFVSFAHPKKFQKKHNVNIFTLYKYIKKLKEKGLDCLEVYYFPHRKKLDIIKYNIIARILQLKVTFGSDFHGKHKGIKLDYHNYLGEWLKVTDKYYKKAASHGKIIEQAQHLKNG